MAADYDQEVRELSLGIVAMHLRRRVDREDVGDTLIALIRAREEPAFPADSNRSDCQFSDVVIGYAAIGALKTLGRFYPVMLELPWRGRVSAKFPAPLVRLGML